MLGTHSSWVNSEAPNDSEIKNQILGPWFRNQALYHSAMASPNPIYDFDAEDPTVA